MLNIKLAHPNTGLNKQNIMINFTLRSITYLVFSTTGKKKNHANGRADKQKKLSIIITTVYCKTDMSINSELAV